MGVSEFEEFIEENEITDIEIKWKNTVSSGKEQYYLYSADSVSYSVQKTEDGKIDYSNCQIQNFISSKTEEVTVTQRWRDRGIQGFQGQERHPRLALGGPGHEVFHPHVQ